MVIIWIPIRNLFSLSLTLETCHAAPCICSGISHSGKSHYYEACIWSKVNHQWISQYGLTADISKHEWQALAQGCIL